MKKIILLILMSFASLSGYSQLDEDFETAPLLPDASGVWAIPNSGNWLVKDNRTFSAPNWQVNTPAAAFPANSGSKAAFINRENGAGAGVLTEEWLITPQLVIPANHQFRFFTRQTFEGNNGSFYQIRVSSDPDQSNLAAFTTLVEYDEPHLSTLTTDQLDYEEKIINLDVSGTLYFAFVKVNTQETNVTSGDRWLVDDVSIVERCPDPTGLNVTDTSAYGTTAVWVSSAANFTIEYGLSGFIPGSAGGTITPEFPNNGTPPATNSHEIIGLQPDTEYQYYVTAICASSVSELTGPFNFTTSPLGSTCDGPIIVTPLGYFDTGDTLQQGNNINPDSPGGGCGVVGSNDYFGGNDVVYLYTVPDTTTGLISIDMNPLGTPNTAVFVYNSCDQIGENCIAGVANPTGGIRSIPALAVNPGDTIYIVVSSTANVDNFVYTLAIQNVTCAPPSGLSATGTGPTTANLSWQNPGNATAWQVYIQNAGETIPAGAGVDTTISTNFGATELTANGNDLALGNPYQYWVRAACGDGTFSQWAGPYLFNTTSCSSGCNYIFEMTDRYGDGWNGATMAVIQDGSTIGTFGETFSDGEGPLTVSIPLCDGPFQLVWTDGGSFPDEVGVAVINSFGQRIYEKEFEEGEPGTTIFNGIVDCAHPSCLPPSDLTFSEVGTFTAILAWVPNGTILPASWDIFVAEVGSAPPADDATPWANTTTYPYTVTGLDPDTEYVFYVRAVCDEPGPNPWSEVSEPFLTLPTCPKPTALGTSNPDMTSIEFHWTPGVFGETSWEYIVLPLNSPPPADNDPNWILTTTTSVTINTGLNSGTYYDFYVRAVCTDTDSSTPAGPFTANTTICPAVEQCAYTFTMLGQFGQGWNGSTMAVIQNGVTVATIGADFTEGDGPVTVTVPLCHGVPFDLFWNDTDNFVDQIGVSITNAFSNVIYTKPPGVGVPGTTLYSGTAECIVQTCIAPTNVIVTASTLDSVTLIWTENNTAASWDVLVQPANLPAPAQNATGWQHVTNPSPYTYGGLTAGIAYKVYVRSNCSDTENSFWSLGVPFNTLVCPPSNVCEYTFVMIDDYGDTWNGNTLSVIQNGAVVATLTGPSFEDDQNPVSVVISLCNDMPFELFWNEGGNYPDEVGISILNAALTEIYTHEPGTGAGAQNTSLFTGTVNCVPATCPKPIQLNALYITETTAQLSWQESGSATQWEIIVQPASAAPPTNDTEGTPATNPITVTLNPGTSYVFYVRAICSEDDQSNWAGPKPFTTLITNDDCSDAIVVPVNPDQSCAQFASGTLIGATASDLPNDCFGTADDDVWFQFQAATSAHNVNITNISGSTTDLYFTTYQGDNCGNLTQLSCGEGTSGILTGLTPGQTYFIRVYSWSPIPQTSSFDICIGTIPPPITSSTTAYSPEELIVDILLNSTCASVSNITFSTGSNFGQTNGIGYFTRNGSSFPFDNGVVLTTGDANNAPGPNVNVLGDGEFDGWPGDPDLQQIIDDQGIGGELKNATTMEFDFIPLTNNLSFDFMFASEEYGGFQCTFSDVFAFLLTDITAGTTINMAVIPGTPTPVTVYNIRNSLYNADCDSANPEYFGHYYQLPEGENELASPTNFNGITVPMTATAPVTAGQMYHIKMAIADYNDNNYDSAVFLKAGSFGLGNIELGENLLEATGNAVCAGGTAVINSGLDPENYTFQWSQNDAPIPGATGPTLTVTAPGDYTIDVVLNNSECTGTDTIIVEYYDEVVPGNAPALVICDTATTGVFNLTQNAAAVTAPIGTGYTLSYYTTLADAMAGSDTNDIDTPTAYTNTSNPQTIYVRAQKTISGCFGVTSFEIMLEDNTPEFTIPATLSFCTGGSQTITVTPTDNDFDLADATYSWTFNNGPLPDTTPSIVVTAPGFYEVTVNLTGCTATHGCTVTEQSEITPTFAAIAPICQNTTAPTLPTTSVNGVTGSWSPTAVNPAVPGTLSYCFTPDASQACAIQVCMDITVIATPTLPAVADTEACESYTLPALTNGGYFSSPNGVGPINAATPFGIGSYTIYVRAESGTTPNCVNEDSFILTVGPAPDVTPIDDVNICTSYTLPALTVGNYYADIDGTQPIDATVPITESQTVFVYASVGTAPNICSDVESFDITIIDLPEIAITSGCVGNDFVLTSSPDFGDATYSWTDTTTGAPIPGGNGPSLTITATGTYHLTITSEGCTAEQDIMVTTVSCGIQRGISPGDGSDNDFFDLAGLNVRKLEIFNRYGTKVYSRDNYSKEWYGQSDKGDELPDGTYYYVIERDNVPTKTGWIYINRVN